MKNLFLVLLTAGVLVTLSCEAKKPRSTRSVTIPKEKYEALKRKQSDKNYITLPRREYDSLLSENEKLKREKSELYLKLLPYIHSGGMDSSKMDKTR